MLLTHKSAFKIKKRYEKNLYNKILTQTTKDTCKLKRIILIIFWRFHKNTCNKIKHIKVFKAQAFHSYLCCNVNTHIFYLTFVVKIIFIQKTYLLLSNRCVSSNNTYICQPLFSLPIILKLRWFFNIKWEWFWDLLTPLKRF